MPIRFLDKDKTLPAFTQYAMKAQRQVRMEIKFHCFLTWTLDEGDKDTGYEAG
jgi:hypothetical protein